MNVRSPEPQRPGHAPRRSLTLITFLLLATAGASGQVRGTVDVTLVWDRNPEPEAAGYFVYVGKLPGVFDEQYDVKDRTTFVYSRPANGQIYYFAVAAYTAEGLAGPKSAAISHVAGEPEPGGSGPIGDDPYSDPVGPEPGGPGIEPDAAALQDLLCLDGAGADCYFTRPLLRMPSAFTGIATTADGQLLMIEDGRHVLMYTPGASHVQRALSMTDRTVTGLAVDPLFARTRFVYVGEARDLRDGSREVAIVRYREVQGTLGDPAVVVPAIRITGDRPVPFGIASNGDVYIATPAATSRNDPYAAAILRFTREGAVPPDAPGTSPVFAHGFAEPVSMAGTARHMWIAGSDDTRAQRFAYLNLPATARLAARRPEAISPRAASAYSPGLSEGASDAALLLTADGHAALCRQSATAGCLRFIRPDGLRFTAVTHGPNDRAYAVLSDRQGMSTLLELRRRTSR